MDKLTCPCCSKEITFLSFVKAPSPWHMGCSECGAKLKQSKFRLPFIVLAFIFGISLGVSAGYTYVTTSSAVFSILVFILGLLAFEAIGFKLLPKIGVGMEQRNA